MEKDEALSNNTFLTQIPWNPNSHEIDEGKKQSSLIGQYPICFSDSQATSFILPYMHCADGTGMHAVASLYEGSRASESVDVQWNRRLQ